MIIIKFACCGVGEPNQYPVGSFLASSIEMYEERKLFREAWR
ncbi:MAG: hypothetical protein NTZ24_15825 [Deltaproteobacteria bacterium]|nr:hypothetical protein [Deltaproteobacteria bacterium]